MCPYVATVTVVVSVPVSEEQINYREGNLRCLLQKAAIKDDVLRLHLTHGPRNASYISAETQNNLISCIGTVMLRQISLEELPNTLQYKLMKQLIVKNMSSS